MNSEYETQKRTLQAKLKTLKESKAWLDGDKKAEGEVANIRKELRQLELDQMTPRDRILARCDYQHEVEDIKDSLSQAERAHDREKATTLREKLEALTS